MLMFGICEDMKRISRFLAVIFVTQSKLTSRTPSEGKISVCNGSWPLTGMCKVQSLYELELKRSFVKLMKSRAARSGSFECIWKGQFAFV